jgi:hypothetical protein
VSQSPSTLLSLVAQLLTMTRWIQKKSIESCIPAQRKNFNCNIVK